MTARARLRLDRAGFRLAHSSGGVAVYQWSATGAGCDEGGSIGFTVTLNRNGITPPAGEQVAFIVGYPGLTYVPAPPLGATSSDFVIGPDVMMQNAADAYNLAHPSNPCTFSYGPGYYEGHFQFDSTWNGVISFSRLTLVHPENQEDRTTGMEITSVSQGTVITPRAVPVILNKATPTNTTIPLLDHTAPVVGVIVTCSTGVWTNTPTSYAYQWQKGTSNIVGATSATYTPVTGDIASTLRCKVTASNANGAGVGVFTAASSAVAASPPASVPVISVIPAISNPNPLVGQAITCSTGTWDNNPTSFTYQWQKVTTDIPGATSASYTPVSGDIGSTLRCGVIATNATGSSTISRSSSTAAVAPGALVSLFLGTSASQYPHGPSVLVSAAQGTVIAPIKGLDSLGNIVTLDSIVFATGGDEGGRLQITGANLEAGAVAPDFNGPLVTQTNGSFYQGIPFYNPTIAGTYNGVTVTTQFQLRAKYAKIAPTGNQTATTGHATTFSNFTNTLTDGIINRTLDMDTFTVNGGRANNQSSSNLFTCAKSNFTWRSNRNVTIAGGGFVLSGGANNVIIRDVSFRPGDDLLGFPFSDRDGFAVLNASRVIFENCEFSDSVDESVSVINFGPYPKDILFYRCIFAEPLSRAGHDQGTHAFGPLVYHFSQNVAIVKSFFSFNAQRSPSYSHGRGYLDQNNIKANYGTAFNNGALAIVGHASWANGQPGPTIISRANLYKPLVLTARDNVYFHNRVGPNFYLNLVEDAPYASHFFKVAGGVPDFTADPVIVSSASTYNASDANAANSHINWQPFDYEEGATPYGLMPTSSSAERLALYNDVLDYVGVRVRDGSGNPVAGDLNTTKSAYGILQRFRQDGTGTTREGAYPNGPPPAARVESAIYYGPYGLDLSNPP